LELLIAFVRRAFGGNCVQNAGQTLRPRDRAAVPRRVLKRLLAKCIGERQTALRLKHLRLIVGRYQNRRIEAGDRSHQPISP
jgi:hypothetical protein